MFWTEIGNVVKIERAGMDGSERMAVVNSSLGWPGGVAVDTISDRVYWTDERLSAIGSATLDGNDIRVNYFGTGLLFMLGKNVFQVFICIYPKACCGLLEINLNPTTQC